MIEAYPLCWPASRVRTPRGYQESARFDTSFARARDNLVREVKLLSGNKWRDPEIIVSTNLPLRRDGLPLAGSKTPDDPGVAVYFTYKTQQMCFACDRWKKIEDNMQAVCKTIEALRGIARWGTGDMMQAAFTGFAALPAPGQSTVRGFRDVLGLAQGDGVEQARDKYRRLSAVHHPDRGGTHEKMAELNNAWEQARAQL